MARGFEVPPGHDLEGVPDINHQSTRLVGDIVPFLILAPDLQTRDGHGEEQRCQAEVGVAVHAQPFGGFLGLFLYGSEESMPEVAFAGGTAVGLDVVPEVVVGEFEDAREEREKSAVDGFGEVVGEGLDFVHEWV